MGVYEYTPTSMSYEGNNRGKREAPTRTGQEHATRETKTTKVNSNMWLDNLNHHKIIMITIGLLVKSSLESQLWFTVLLIIAVIPKGPLKSPLES